MPGPAFLDLPARTAKPRRTGITHVLDAGIPLCQVADLLDMCAAYVDVWKLGWGVAYLDPNLDAGIPLCQVADLLDMCAAYVDVWKFGWGVAYLDPNLDAKLELLAAHRVLASPGGTLLEIAWSQGRAAEFLDWARASGFPCVEVSAGTVPMSADAQAGLIAEAAEHFIVLAEVGAKDPAVRLAPDEWAAAVTRVLDAGATWVIAEGRASGTVGIYSASGEVREKVVEAMADAAGTDSLVFEAPRSHQQAWFVRRFGPDVNLANIRPADALSLETLRLSLRADTYAARPASTVACRT